MTDIAIVKETHTCRNSTAHMITIPPPSESTERAIGIKREILPDAIYTTEEAADLCCVMPSTIRAAVRRGIIRGKGRPYRFRGLELFKLV